jgi:hypothetical protein
MVSKIKLCMISLHKISSGSGKTVITWPTCSHGEALFEVSSNWRHKSILNLLSEGRCSRLRKL